MACGPARRMTCFRASRRAAVKACRPLRAPEGDLENLGSRCLSRWESPPPPPLPAIHEEDARRCLSRVGRRPEAGEAAWAARVRARAGPRRGRIPEDAGGRSGSGGARCGAAEGAAERPEGHGPFLLPSRLAVLSRPRDERLPGPSAAKWGRGALRGPRGGQPGLPAPAKLVVLQKCLFFYCG